MREKKKHPDLHYDSHVKTVVEEQVNKLNNVLDRHKGEKVDIACITFGYKNGELIKLLKLRGYQLKIGMWEEVSKIDKQIKSLVEDQSKFDKFITPTWAFITFVEQEGNERCEEYLMRKTRSGKINKGFRTFKILGDDSRIEDAVEPSNVIWENLEVPGKEHLKRKIIVGLIFCVLMFLVASFFTYLKSDLAQVRLMYPLSRDCN